MRQALLVASLTVMALGTVRADSAADESFFSRTFAAAQANLAVDFVRCSVYYTIAGELVRRHGGDSGDESARIYTEAAAAALQAAVGLSSYGMTSARGRLLLDEMLDEVGGGSLNVEILYARYGESCQELSENPGVRLRELLDEERASEQRRINRNPFLDP